MPTGVVVILALAILAALPAPSLAEPPRPDVVFTSGPGVDEPAATNDPTPTFGLTDPTGLAVSYHCFLDGPTMANPDCTSPSFTIDEELADGQYEMVVLAWGEAPFCETMAEPPDPCEIDAMVPWPDPTPAVVSFEIDLTPPETTIGPMSALQRDTSPSFPLASTAEGSTFRCRIDGGGYEPCSSPFEPGTLSYGAHSVWAEATDPAGNVDPSPAQQQVYVAPPNVAPRASITTKPKPRSKSKKATFAFTSNEPKAIFRCSVDGLPARHCTSPFTTANLRRGSHFFSVVALDAEGASSIPAEHGWKFVPKKKK